MKIGFIDNYLDEWHANNLPGWLREIVDVEAIYAYERIPSPIEGAIDGREWAKKFDAIYCDTIEEVVENSDALIVLAPSFPDLHEELCDLPLKSGKPTYVDKTFAPDAATTVRLIEKAKAHNTPLFTTSALRYSNELPTIDRENIQTIGMRGPGPLEMYCIHYIEPMICLLGTEVEAVMFTGTVKNPGYVVRFSGDRWVMAEQLDSWPPFKYTVSYADDKPAVFIDACNDFFDNFVKVLVKFFETKEIPVDYKETIAVIATRHALLKAKDIPGEWVAVEKG